MASASRIGMQLLANWLPPNINKKHGTKSMGMDGWSMRHGDRRKGSRTYVRRPTLTAAARAFARAAATAGWRAGPQRAGWREGGRGGFEFDGACRVSRVGGFVL